MSTLNKTLIIRLSSIGDVVLTSPLVRALRKQYPSAQIDFVVRKEYAELVRHNTNLSHCYEFATTTGFSGLRKLKIQIRKEKYDLVIDIHNSLRSRYLRMAIGAREVVTINKRILARTMLVKFKKNSYTEIVSVADRYIEPVKAFGIQNDGKGLDLFMPSEIKEGTKKKVLESGMNPKGKFIGLCPSAKHATKCWPEERFAELGIRLAKELNVTILLFGGPVDCEKNASISKTIQTAWGIERAIDLSGRLSLLETAAAMEMCEVIVTNDSGLMHIAAAMKRKIVAIFGSTVEEFGFFPVGTESIILERKGLPCRPCSHIGRKYCPKKHFLCMKEIQIEDVLNAVLTISRRR